jgi:hypothetical protein
LHPPPPRLDPSGLLTKAKFKATSPAGWGAGICQIRFSSAMGKCHCHGSPCTVPCLYDPLYTDKKKGRLFVSFLGGQGGCRGASLLHLGPGGRRVAPAPKLLQPGGLRRTLNVCSRRPGLGTMRGSGAPTPGPGEREGEAVLRPHRRTKGAAGPGPGARGRGEKFLRHRGPPPRTIAGPSAGRPAATPPPRRARPVPGGSPSCRPRPPPARRGHSSCSRTGSG